MGLSSALLVGCGRQSPDHAEHAGKQDPAARPARATAPATEPMVRAHASTPTGRAAGTGWSALPAEQALGVRLPRLPTETGAPFPLAVTRPQRRLRGFDPERTLHVVRSPAEIRALGATLELAKADDAERLRAFLRALVTSWTKRSGMAARRIVLVVDREVSAQSARALHRAAQQAHSWRVYALMRSKAGLVEVGLDPPPQSRPKQPIRRGPAPSVPPTATRDG